MHLDVGRYERQHSELAQVKARQVAKRLRERQDGSSTSSAPGKRSLNIVVRVVMLLSAVLGARGPARWQRSSWGLKLRVQERRTTS